VRVTAAIETLEPAQAAAPMRPGVSSIAPERDGPDPAEIVANALHRHGVPPSLSDRIVETLDGFVTHDPVLALGAALDKLFGFQPLAEGPGSPPIMLVGPPGGGKTLSIAKLATRAALKGRSVGVISTDTARAGGVEQLAAFTKLLKIQLLTVEDAPCLADALQVQEGCEVLLIDSAGRNPYDADDMADIAGFVKAGKVEPVLVLPIGMDAVEAAETAKSFREIGVKRLLITRLDVGRRLGALLSCAYEARLALCDSTASPNVAAGMTALNPVALARLLLPAEAQSPAQAQLQSTGT
jgi:flagellar biosynthesis protein FlhF